MRKQSKLLKVLSIILIVIGCLTLISSIISVAMRGVVEETYATMGIAAPTTLSYALMFIGAFILLASGIVGVAYKSKQSVLIMGVILAIYYVANIIYSTVTAGFSAWGLIGLLWPILYLWGWYQSN
ncbi:hypothetical protein [Faecalicatena contorta]|uniref:DUF4064 domain-containing protein n=1 Tax=Faecalicatena contorta TaxID=39482 RepID=A0A316AHZ9_9FIRM|nr:hypothetical protein [Faecalicatena contorta]PWJ49527.1 hypothetical protein A8805_107234 [Faecalicatena contorta]SUQ14771.1 hypothetical protein SAMN05216529_107234 [Faecalicatena contorta]